MSVLNLNFAKYENYWETEPLKCVGGDVRVRIHKNGPYPIDVMVSIDGCEEYLCHDYFGFDERMSEITLEGVMPGQYLKFRSRSEFIVVKYLEM